MTIELSRRSFLKGLAGVAVIAALPKPIIHAVAAEPKIAQAAEISLDVQAPPGITYQWVRTALMGEPDMENLQNRLDSGWTFVRPSAHPEMPVTDAAIAFETGGLILMEMPTVEVERRRYEHQSRHKHWRPEALEGHSSPLRPR